jgi:hypothetical protein
VAKGDELSAGFLILIIGPIIKIKNRRINETLPNDVDHGTSSSNLRIKTNTRENIPTIVCCIGVFLISIILY